RGRHTSFSRDWSSDVCSSDLAAGERIVATYGAAISAERFCGMFTSFDTAEDVFRWSPGDLMLHHLVGLMSARGLKVFDLGVGEEIGRASRREGGWGWVTPGRV